MPLLNKLYPAETVDKILQDNDMNQTIRFVHTVQVLAAVGHPLPDYIAVALTDLILNAGAVRNVPGWRKETLAAALSLGRKDLTTRNTVYGQCVLFYRLKGYSVSDSARKTRALIKQHAALDVLKLTQLKNAFYDLTIEQRNTVEQTYMDFDEADFLLLPVLPAKIATTF